MEQDIDEGMEEALESISIEEKVKDFLSKAIVFVIDASPSSCLRLVQNLMGLGVSEKNIKSFSSYTEITAILQSSKPHLLFSEQAIADKSVFDLWKEFKKNPDYEQTIFILLTACNDHALISRAIEEELDAFVLKPYSEGLFNGQLQTIIQDKIVPSQYLRMIAKGKSFLKLEQPNQAIDFFKRALPLHDTPVLACYYYAQAELMLNAIKNAEERYREGIAYNHIHYKCLQGLFGLLYKESRYQEAYELLREMIKFFSINADRLTKLIRLSVQTNNFNDIDDYYNAFMSSEFKTKDASKYICAGLIICGRYFLNNNNFEKAMNLFERARTISPNDSKQLLYVIQNLIEFNFEEAAKNFFQHFTSEMHSSKEYQICEFLVKNSERSATDSLAAGYHLLNQGLKDYCLYSILIRRLKQLDKVTEQQELIATAEALWPEKRHLFS
ncbi:MAG: hypothetical protein HQK50_04615 [Oligoflexia bacterium]|nr:hypothetical protein [Oligoflexia bacterium]MBF0364828.1 hypothetical protein [Oligoflexia bacterium]